MKRIYILILLLFIPITYAATTPSPGVFAPTPKAIFLYPGEKGEFTIEVDNTKSEFDSVCSFSIEGGKSNFLTEISSERIEVKSGEKNKINVDVTVPLGFAPGRYIERICANCGLSRSVCTSCQMTSSCEYILDITVLKGTVDVLLPQEEIECYEDSDCAPPAYCPDGTAYKRWACVKYKCQEVYYAEDPCIRMSELSILEQISFFLKDLLESFFWTKTL